MHKNKTIEWLSEKLSIDSEGLELFINADYKAYFKQSLLTRVKTANCVQYHHSKIGLIYLGPDFIKIRRKIVAKIGYESEEYIRKVQNPEN